MCLWGQGQNGQLRTSLPPHPAASPAPAQPHAASPCVEKVLVHNVLEGDADPGRQLPEEARGELPTDLGKGRPWLLSTITPRPLT